MRVDLLAWAWAAPVSTRAKLVLIALTDGYEDLPTVSQVTGFSLTHTLDAYCELGRSRLVLWHARRPYFRVGEHYIDSGGWLLDVE